MFEKFQQKFKELLEFATVNAAGVTPNSTGSFGNTSTPVPFPFSGDGFDKNTYATMSIVGGTSPSKKKKSHFPKTKRIKMPKLPNNVGKFPLARRKLTRTT
jgi:hypothetical protein